MAKTISINDEIISTTKINKRVRQGIARICQTSTLTANEKLAQVKRYLQNCKEVRAIVINNGKLTVFTSGECASQYTYTI